MSKRAVVSILAVLVLLGGALATVLLIRAGSGSAEVPGSVSPVLSRAQRLGPLPPDRRLPVNVVLRPKDERGLFAVARTVSDPASPEHGHYLSPAELNMRFAPPTGTVQAVVEYLRSRDLEVTAPGLGGDVVTAVGSVRALEATFGVHLYRWRDRTNGESFFANDAAVRLPSDLAPAVVAVLGLDDAVRLEPGAGTVSNLPGLSPFQLLEAYDLRALIESHECFGLVCDGSGETVAIFAEGGFNRADIETFDAQWGLPPPSLTVESFLSSPLAPFWSPKEMTRSRDEFEAEAELDIETVHAIAPGAAIHVYELPRCCLALDLTLFFEKVRLTREPVVSISYGHCESDLASEVLATLASQSAMLADQAQSVFAGSGDTGKNCSDDREGVDFPASLPFVTSVGGTRLEVNHDGSHKDETSWDDGRHASGGGTSVQPQPWWQFEAKTDQHRLVPDVAADAARSSDDVGRGVLGIYAYDDSPLFASDHWFQEGGTSAAAPVWAGFAAILDQYAGAHEAPALGSANPTLYSLAAHQQAYAPFFDVTANGDRTGLLAGQAGPGWDYATGLGSFDGYNLARDLAPSLVADPTAGPSGTELTVLAYPFATGDTVEFSWGPDLERLCTAQADDDHTATCSGTIRSDAPNGTMLPLRADDGATDITASGAFALESVSGPGKIVFQQDGGAISEMNADGTDVRQVPITGPLCCSYPALSPDGTRLVFTSEGALSVANADGTQAEDLWTSGTVSAFEPTWSPSGDRIAFWESGVDASGALVLQDLDIVEADGSGNPRVVLGNADLEAPDAEASGLAWSPDGTELAFVSSSGGIDVISVSSGAVHSILWSEQPAAPDAPAVVALTWAPGPKLLFEAAGVTGYSIEEVNSDGSDVRPLLPRAGHISPNYSSPSWGPDGVHFSAIRDGRVVIATVDQGVQDVLPPQGVLYAQWG